MFQSTVCDVVPDCMTDLMGAGQSQEAILEAKSYMGISCTWLDPYRPRMFKGFA